MDVLPLDVVTELESRGLVRVQRTRDFRIDQVHTGGNSRMNLCKLDPDRVNRILAHRAKVERKMNENR